MTIRGTIPLGGPSLSLEPAIVYPNLKFGFVASSNMLGNLLLQYLIVHKLRSLSSRQFPLSSPMILCLIELHTEIWFIKMNCCTHGCFFPVMLTTPINVMVMLPAAFIASFLSMKLHLKNRLSMTRASIYTGSVLFIPNWIWFHLQHFSVFLSAVNMLTSPSFH